MNSITIEIDALPPPLLRENGRRRRHWGAQLRAGRNMVLLTRKALEPMWGDLPELPWERAIIDVVFVPTVRRRRDAANFLSGLKEVIDYLCVPTPKRNGAGIIADDSEDHLEIGGIRFEVDRERGPKTIITITRRE